LGAIVTLSDALHLPRCIDNCQKACAANNLESSIRVIGLTWGQFSPDLVQIGPLDVILGSDCFYNSKGILCLQLNNLNRLSAKMLLMVKLCINVVKKRQIPKFVFDSLL